MLFHNLEPPAWRAVFFGVSVVAGCSSGVDSLSGDAGLSSYAAGSPDDGSSGAGTDGDPPYRVEESGEEAPSNDGGSDRSDDDDDDDDDDGGTSGTSGTTTANAPSDGESGIGIDDGGTGFDTLDPGVVIEGCPTRWPDAWLFCEDFESEEDLRDAFFEYQDGDGFFVRAGDVVRSGHYSMRASYMQGVESAGWLTIALGILPEAFQSRPAYASDRHIDEVYWRVWVQTEAGWPDRGPHRLASVLSVADADFRQAVVAHVGSDGDNVVLRGDAATCVAHDTTPCEAFEDTAALTLVTAQGTTPVYSAAYSGDWHCIEGHVRLNAAGQADGAFDFSVDGRVENGQEELMWRSEWSAFGLNLVTFENFWTGGAPENLRRWMDDIVISTAPIGCGSRP